jgi:putative ABC transport system permease protein
MQRLEELLSDVRLAVRQLISARGFTLVAALTLALGIGVNSAIFSLADAALMRPLPFGEVERLVMLWERTPTSTKTGVSPLNMRDWNLQSRSFEGIAFVQRGMGGGPLLTAPDGSIETAERQSTSANFFDVLKVIPIVGRTFKLEDDGPSPRVVLLGEAVWRRRFSSDPSIVGRLVRLNGQPYTVVGVVADTVQFSRPAEIWTLTGQFPDIPTLRAARAFEVVARLKPGVTIEEAQAELNVIAERLAHAYPEANKGTGVIVEPIRAGIVGSDLATTSMFLLGVVGFVLLLCCANVANLLLARAAGRAREIAIRSALGAARGRIIRQLLTESLVLAVLGGMLGIGVGAAILRAAPALIPPGLLPAAVTRVRRAGRAVWSGRGAGGGRRVRCHTRVAGDGRVAAGVMASSRSSTSTTGASQPARVRRGGRGGRALMRRRVAAADAVEAGRRRHRLSRDERVGPDARLQRAHGEELTVSNGGRGHTVLRCGGPRRQRVARSAPRRLGVEPAVRHERAGPVGLRDRRRSAGRGARSAERGVHDRRSRILRHARPADRERARLQRPRHTAQPACVSRQRSVRAPAFPGTQPNRRALSLIAPFNGPLQIREIVGVARQTSGEPDAPEELLQVYVPLAQFPTGDVYMVVQPSAGAAETLTPLVRRVVARIDPDSPVRRDRTLETLSVASTAGYRFRAEMVGTFAALALLLAMVGVFGVLAYTVQQRQREIGVRMALGATSFRVTWLVFRDAGWMIATGAASGMVVAALSGRVVATFLFGVDPLDPLTFVSVPVVILLTAIIAAAAPAWRASRINPVEAFRYDG